MDLLPDLPDRDWRDEEPPPQGFGRAAYMGILGALALLFVGMLWALRIDLVANALFVGLGAVALVGGASRAFYLMRDRRQSHSKPPELRVIEIVDAEHAALSFSDGRSILGEARSKAPTLQGDGTWRVYNLRDGYACYCPSTGTYRLSRGGSQAVRFESAVALARHLEGSRRLTRVVLG